MDVSVGIITHDDTTLISLVKSVLNQKTPGFHVKEVFIVSSSILPENKDELEQLAKKESKLKITLEPERTGKARSVNIFLKNVSADVCVLISGDVLIEPNSLAELIKPLADEGVGMVGARTIPLNDESTFIGFAVHLIWRIHHKLSTLKPKLGELVAFRNVVDEIYPYTAVDEAWIEALIIEKGFKTAYAPDSIVHNMGPQKISEYINQRKRIHVGHVNLKREQKYVVSSMMYSKVFNAFMDCLPSRPKEILWTILVILLELYVRVSADIDVLIFKKKSSCWDILSSAKFNK
jgi:biofilm PGA synthesis N-glycosyltransferase PgaC